MINLMVRIYYFSTLQVKYHPFTKEEQLEALEMEKQAMEERKRLKQAGVIGSTMDAVGGKDENGRNRTENSSTVFYFYI